VAKKCEKLGGRHDDKENVGPSSSKKLWIGKWKAPLFSCGCHDADTKKSLETKEQDYKEGTAALLFAVKQGNPKCIPVLCWTRQRRGDNTFMPTDCGLSWSCNWMVRCLSPECDKRVWKVMPQYESRDSSFCVHWTWKRHHSVVTSLRSWEPRA